MDSIHLQQTLPQVFADRNSITSDVWHRNLVFHKGKSYLIEAASGTGKSPAFGGRRIPVPVNHRCAATSTATETTIRESSTSTKPISKHIR